MAPEFLTEGREEREVEALGVGVDPVLGIKVHAMALPWVAGVMLCRRRQRHGLGLRTVVIPLGRVVRLDVGQRILAVVARADGLAYRT
jgi:hypothetical protein